MLGVDITSLQRVLFTVCMFTLVRLAYRFLFVESSESQLAMQDICIWTTSRIYRRGLIQRVLVFKQLVP